MARRYARDNRGRFAGKGAGATARGGRLKTAAGNKRATQTMKSDAMLTNTIGKSRKPNSKTSSTKKPIQNQAPKRLEFQRVYHGTDSRSSDAIRSSGYKESRYGAAGAGVYTSSSRSVARSYADNHIEVYGGKIHNHGRVLAHRVPKSRIQRMDSPSKADATPEFHKSQSRIVQSTLADRRSAALLKGDALKTVLMSKEVADRTLVKNTSTVRASKRRRKRN